MPADILGAYVTPSADCCLAWFRLSGRFFRTEISMLAPSLDNTASNSFAVLLGGTGMVSCLTIGPTSNLLGLICMMVTPVTVSPRSTVWMMGAGPRHLGRQLGCTFNTPSKVGQTRRRLPRRTPQRPHPATRAPAAEPALRTASRAALWATARAR